MRSLLIVLFLGGNLLAAEPIPNAAPAVPAAIACPLDGLHTLTAPAGSTWTLGTELRCGLWPDAGGASCRVSPSVPGRHVVLAFSGGTVTRFVVEVGPPAPMPPGPDVPPTPPKPPPPGPDPLKALLADAFKADAGEAAQKKADVLELAALYAAGAEGCCLGEKDDAGKPILDKNGRPKFTYDTPKQLLDAVRKVGNGKLGDRLKGLREAFKIELQKVLPALDTPFTDDARAKAADLFKRAEAILEALGK
jgi:hypothetical protein